ncbi:MAG: HAD family phosphatase [Cyanobacteria bacterium Co-bin13]|nr:HAD family phosphatase [Cyanobacteria bacterium Co-bin13]
MPDFHVLSSPFFAKRRSSFRLIASDMDGTLTWQGEFTPALIQALQDLQTAGIAVLIVTGRSAGWVSGLVQYLPVAGAIAENGGLFFPKTQADPTLLVDIADLTAHRQQLAELFATLQTQWPQLQPSNDNRYRLTDWTFDVTGLSQSELDEMAQICDRAGWGFTYSTVQCHIKLAHQSKSAALLQVLSRQFPAITPDEVVTVGDSPNDESLFDPAAFPHSVGVANIQHYWETLNYKPVYVTHSPESQGFLELSQALLEVRSRRLRED